MEKEHRNYKLPFPLINKHPSAAQSLNKQSKNLSKLSKEKQIWAGTDVKPQDAYYTYIWLNDSENSG